MSDADAHIDAKTFPYTRPERTGVSDPFTVDDIIYELQDEIERLRDALERAADDLETGWEHPPRGVIATAKRIRKALRSEGLSR